MFKMHRRVSGTQGWGSHQLLHHSSAMWSDFHFQPGPLSEEWDEGSPLPFLHNWVHCPQLLLCRVYSEALGVTASLGAQSQDLCLSQGGLDEKQRVGWGQGPSSIQGRVATGHLGQNGGGSMGSRLQASHLGPGCHQANGFLFLSLLFFICKSGCSKSTF